MNPLFDLQRWLQSSALEALNTLQVGGVASAPWLMAAAFAFGLLHTLLPGHGKLLLASYHAGHGRPQEALLSSIVVITTHVTSAIIIVLAGFSILKRTLGGAGRAPQIEFVSQVLILLIGFWLLWRAFRRHEHGVPPASGFGLAFVAGLVPCPLTTFIMTYAVAKGAVTAGLILSGFFALGMIVTVAIFPMLAVWLRTRGLDHIASDRSNRLMRFIEIISATAIIAIGAAALVR